MFIDLHSTLNFLNYADTNAKTQVSNEERKQLSDPNLGMTQRLNINDLMFWNDVNLYLKTKG